MPDPEGAVEATDVTGWGRNGDRGSRVAGSYVVRGADPAGQVDPGPSGGVWYLGLIHVLRRQQTMTL